MNRSIRLILAGAALALGTVACGGSGTAARPVTTQPETPTDFKLLTQSVATTKPETTEPLDISGTTFSNQDTDDESAYDGALAAGTP